MRFQQYSFDVPCFKFSERFFEISNLITARTSHLVGFFIAALIFKGITSERTAARPSHYTAGHVLYKSAQDSRHYPHYFSCYAATEVTFQIALVITVVGFIIYLLFKPLSFMVGLYGVTSSIILMDVCDIQYLLVWKVRIKAWERPSNKAKPLLAATWKQFKSMVHYIKLKHPKLARNWNILEFYFVSMM